MELEKVNKWPDEVRECVDLLCLFADAATDAINATTIRVFTHRRTEECGTCRFWIVMQGYQGECHKLSPSEGSWGGGHYDAVWPETTSNRWCGEYEYESVKEKKDE